MINAILILLGLIFWFGALLGSAGLCLFVAQAAFAYGDHLYGWGFSAAALFQIVHAREDAAKVYQLMKESK